MEEEEHSYFLDYSTQLGFQAIIVAFFFDETLIKIESGKICKFENDWRWWNTQVIPIN